MGVGAIGFTSTHFRGVVGRHCIPLIEGRDFSKVYKVVSTPALWVGVGLRGVSVFLSNESGDKFKGSKSGVVESARLPLSPTYATDTIILQFLSMPYIQVI